MEFAPDPDKGYRTAAAQEQPQGVVRAMQQAKAAVDGEQARGRGGTAQKEVEVVQRGKDFMAQAQGAGKAPGASHILIEGFGDTPHARRPAAQLDGKGHILSDAAAAEAYQLATEKIRPVYLVDGRMEQDCPAQQGSTVASGGGEKFSRRRRGNDVNPADSRIKGVLRDAIVQPRQEMRRQAIVDIHKDKKRAATRRDARISGDARPAVCAKLYDADTRVSFLPEGTSLHGIVRRGIVNKDDLVRRPPLRKQLLHAGSYPLGGIVDGNDDGNMLRHMIMFRCCETEGRESARDNGDGFPCRE